MNTMKITMKSIFSGIERTLDLPITQEQYDLWAIKGVLIQDAMPELTPEEREFIMTGMIQEEWDETFKEKEDE